MTPKDPKYYVYLVPVEGDIEKIHSYSTLFAPSRETLSNLLGLCKDGDRLLVTSALTGHTIEVWRAKAEKVLVLA